MDLSGLTGSSLKDFANTTNVILKNKDDLNKENIELSLIEDPSKYLSYCYDDTVYLFKMLLNFQILNYQIYMNSCLQEFPSLMGFWNNSLRPTNGSNLARYIKSYIYNLSPEMNFILDSFSISVNRISEKKLFYIKGIEMGSSTYLKYLGGSAIEGCFVSGGRCCNERPFEQSFKNGLDVDLVQCYGKSITNLYYPIGIPRILRNPEGGFIMNLRDFLKKKYQLIPGLWYAIISTKEDLSFNCDLFVSKYIPNKSFYTSDREFDGMHINGDQMVSSKQILHAVMIHEHINIISKMASNSEKSELYSKIHIEMACIYPKKYRCNTIEEFNSKVAMHEAYKDKNLKKKEDGSREDNRPPYWYGIPMS